MPSISNNDVSEIGKGSGVTGDRSFGIVPNRFARAVESLLAGPRENSKSFFCQSGAQNNVVLPIVHENSIILHKSGQAGCHWLHPVTNKIAFHSRIVIPKRAPCTDVEHFLNKATIQVCLIRIRGVHRLDKVEIIRQSSDVAKERRVWKEVSVKHFIENGKCLWPVLFFNGDSDVLFVSANDLAFVNVGEAHVVQKISESGELNSRIDGSIAD